MGRAKLPRRRSPYWLRHLDSRDLHAIAFRLRRDQATQDLTDRQEWLWDAIISELTWRSATAARGGGGRVCVCELCVGPFDEHAY